uniref:Uncharacterized protein n=1 Tax=Physcomitrium patens TaxID=3218 RepID=A0A2K1JDM7_PHYPA|nr:hypothetical protein PHYPA_019911 [Physcomitrium patens]
MRNVATAGPITVRMTRSKRWNMATRATHTGVDRRGHRSTAAIPDLEKCMVVAVIELADATMRLSRMRVWKLATDAAILHTGRSLGTSSQDLPTAKRKSLTRKRGMETGILDVIMMMRCRRSCGINSRGASIAMSAMSSITQAIREPRMVEFLRRKDMEVGTVARKTTRRQRNLVTEVGMVVRRRMRARTRGLTVLEAGVRRRTARTRDLMVTQVAARRRTMTRRMKMKTEAMAVTALVAMTTRRKKRHLRNPGGDPDSSLHLVRRMEHLCLSRMIPRHFCVPFRHGVTVPWLWI